jgi:cellobiose PTS system EIIA component
MAENENEALEAAGSGATSAMDALIADCFQIIANVGVAKSSYINAVKLAKEGKFDEAAQSVADGDEAFKLGHDVHLGLLQRTAAGEALPFTLILLHAEDQMAAAETFRVVAGDFIDVHKELIELKGKLA